MCHSAAGQCDVCNEGYVLDRIGYTCTACGDNCLSCNLNGAGKCDLSKCRTGSEIETNSVYDPANKLCQGDRKLLMEKLKLQILILPLYFYQKFLTFIVCKILL
ncbi:hypothetical protein HELRODRAFT_158746 [Helobdella robusta]|uniref:Uncharacterized protein n=1 Tax=Helobdella robusta TaxID=6412 RepID=T1EN70_HELRO|nr:hypothetical protein HELRODRAFT_158746 [Helobdella robusta]ESO12266.1 hypothetical protein HELRODRAFT_158746 [Helobdella robusta]